MYKQEHQKYLDLLNMKNRMQKENIEDCKAFREKIADLVFGVWQYEQNFVSFIDGRNR